MKTALIIILGCILLTYIGIIADRLIKRRKYIKWVPTIVTDWNYFMNLKQFKYIIDFNHIILPSGEAKYIHDKDLYIISGNGLKDQVLQDGRKISLEDGDMIVVDPQITDELKKVCRAFLVSPKGKMSVCKESRLKTSDKVAADDVILGGVIAKIPASWIEQYRIE